MSRSNPRSGPPARYLTTAIAAVIAILALAVTAIVAPRPFAQPVAENEGEGERGVSIEIAPFVYGPEGDEGFIPPDEYIFEFECFGENGEPRTELPTPSPLFVHTGDVGYIDGLAVGDFCEIHETNAEKEGYDLSVSVNGSQKEGPSYHHEVVGEGSGVLKYDFTYTAQKAPEKLYSLTVRKDVTGPEDEGFAAPESFTIDYECEDADGNPVETASPASPLTVVDGQSVKVSGLPAGTLCTFTENLEQAVVGGYDLKVLDASGTEHFPRGVQHGYVEKDGVGEALVFENTYTKHVDPGITPPVTHSVVVKKALEAPEGFTAPESFSVSYECKDDNGNAITGLSPASPLTLQVGDTGVTIDGLPAFGECIFTEDLEAANVDGYSLSVKNGEKIAVGGVIRYPLAKASAGEVVFTNTYAKTPPPDRKGVSSINIDGGKHLRVILGVATALGVIGVIGSALAKIPALAPVPAPAPEVVPASVPDTVDPASEPAPENAAPAGNEPRKGMLAVTGANVTGLSLMGLFMLLLGGAFISRRKMS